MKEVIELSYSSDETESFHHDLSDRDEWVAEGYDGGDSETSGGDGDGIEEDQVTGDSGQDEEETNDGADSSDDQEKEDAGKARFAGMWSPTPGEMRRSTRPSATYHDEGDSSNASDHDERAEPPDYSRGRRPESSQHDASQ